MVVILKPEALRNPEHPPIADMVNAVENLCSLYFHYWQKFPRYCYMNTQLWEDVQEGMWDSIMMIGLIPVTTPNFPYGRISVHSDYHNPEDLAKWHKQIEDGDGEDSGRLEVV